MWTATVLACACVLVTARADHETSLPYPNDSLSASTPGKESVNEFLKTQNVYEDRFETEEADDDEYDQEFIDDYDEEEDEDEDEDEALDDEDDDDEEFSYADILGRLSSIGEKLMNHKAGEHAYNAAKQGGLTGYLAGGVPGAALGGLLNGGRAFVKNGGMEIFDEDEEYDDDDWE